MTLGLSWSARNNQFWGQAMSEGMTRTTVSSPMASVIIPSCCLMSGVCRPQNLLANLPNPASSMVVPRSKEQREGAQYSNQLARYQQLIRAPMIGSIRDSIKVLISSDAQKVLIQHKLARLFAVVVPRKQTLCC